MNRKVKRYDPINSDGTCGMCVEDADYGAYVEFADYAALEAERDQLRAEVERLKAQLAEEIQRRFDGNKISSNEHREEVQRLQAQLAQQQGVPEGWRDAYGRLVEFIKNADVSSGVCCCGGRADHQYDDHSPVDMWDHCVLEIVKEYEAMLAAAPAPAQAEPASPWVAVAERQPLKWQTVLVAYESDADGEPCLDVGSAALGADGKFYGMGHFYVLGTATLEPRICVKPVTHWMPLPPAPEVKA